MSNHSVKGLACALAGVLLVFLSVAPSIADDRSEIEELRQRMEALEKQNHEMLKALQPQPDGPPKEPGKGMVGEASKQSIEPKREAGDWFEIGKQLDLRARWDNGMWYLETADRAFRIHVGGRSQFDVVWLNGDRQVQFGRGGVGPVLDGVNFRRARLEVDGTLYDTVDFWCEYDFLNTVNLNLPNPPTPATTANVPAPTDVWLTFTHLPVIGNVRVGNQKPPISLEHLTSSRFLNFMERSLPFDAYIDLQDNGFRPGIQMFNWIFNERATWAIGLFNPNRNVYGWSVGDGEFELTGRVTALPIYLNEGRCLVHVGLGATHAKPDDSIARFRARTLLRPGPFILQPVLANTQPLASSYQLLVPEFALIWGPLQIAAEYYANWNHGVIFPVEPVTARVNRGTTFTQGFYVEALYFLTGEHRIYNRRAYENRRIASFDRVIPNENFFFVRKEDGRLGLGSGAWQVGARWSYVDLQDKGVGIGAVHDVTLGLNWFWNPNMKFQANYVVEWRDVNPPNTADGLIHGFGTRVEWNF
jgi:phosphate-selective porin OprO/OprP